MVVHLVEGRETWVEREGGMKVRRGKRVRDEREGGGEEERREEEGKWGEEKWGGGEVGRRGEVKREKWG